MTAEISSLTAEKIRKVYKAEQEKAQLAVQDWVQTVEGSLNTEVEWQEHIQEENLEKLALCSQ